MAELHIVGVGPGGADLLTIDAQNAIAQSAVVFAAMRHRHLIPSAIKARCLEPIGEALDQIAQTLHAGLDTTVLVSGDTGLYSMLPMLRNRFGAAALSAHPGISALQSLCAATHDTWQNAKIVSGHGRALSVSALGHFARTNEKLIVFCDAEHGAQWAALALISEGLTGVQMTIGERLSYPDQRIRTGALTDFVDAECDPLALVMIHNPRPTRGLPMVGLSDDAFIRNKVPMTKREVRVQILAELQLALDSVVWDIGAGTGSVSIECARQCPLGGVFAIERDEAALALIERNRGAFHLNNLTVVSGVAPGALAGLPQPTHVFVGGSGGQMDAIFDAIEALSGPVRIVGTAVSMEGVQRLLDRMRGMAGFRMAQIAVSRVEPIGQVHLLRAQNSVWVASADFEGARS